MLTQCLILLLAALTDVTIALPAPTTSIYTYNQAHPNYTVLEPVHQMDLQIYRSNATAPCAGFEAVDYKNPEPLNTTDCINQIPAAPDSSNVTCVKRRVDDGNLNSCSLLGYLDQKCGGEPVDAGRVAVNGAWIWGLETGKTIDIRSFKISC